MDGKQIKNLDAIVQFALAGDAIFTLVSKETGKRFTYRVTRAKGDDAERPWFVKVLTGSDNEHSYTFVGTVFGLAADLKYVHSFKKSPIGADAPSAAGIAWFVETLRRFEAVTLAGAQAEDAGDALANVLDRAAKVEFWHEGKCGRCGRTLTVPASIDLGIGPDCAEAMGL